MSLRSTISIRATLAHQVKRLHLERIDFDLGGNCSDTLALISRSAPDGKTPVSQAWTGACRAASSNATDAVAPVLMNLLQQCPPVYRPEGRMLAPMRVQHAAEPGQLPNSRCTASRQPARHRDRPTRPCSEDPFPRPTPAPRRYGGLGLKRDRQGLVQMMGRLVRVSNEPGKGTGSGASTCRAQARPRPPGEADGRKRNFCQHRPGLLASRDNPDPAWTAWALLGQLGLGRQTLPAARTG